MVHTSVLRRATRTAEITLKACGRDWIPGRRHWRLNERHYGALQGKSKKEIRQRFGEAQYLTWRRSYDTPPPPLEDLDFPRIADPRYAGLPPELIPRTGCLKDVLERTLPYWYDAIVPELRNGHTVLVAAHSNSIRALVKHLDQISDADIVGHNIPTGMPLRYDFDDDLKPLNVGGKYLDPETAEAAAKAVAAQGQLGH